MKHLFQQLNIYLLLILLWLFHSCQKEISCEGCSTNPPGNNANKPPIALAGPDQVVTLPMDSMLLDGTASRDPDGRINTWLWRKIDGPSAFTIHRTADSITRVRNLVAGVYRFELSIADNLGLSAKDTMQVTVLDPTQPNRPPVANAGLDQVIILPANTVTLNGSGSTDPDNNITRYLWTKIEGPAAYTILSTGTVQTQVNDLLQGTYQFELNVTDAGGLFDKDTIRVTVIQQLPCSQPFPPPPCSLNCGKIVFVSDRDGNNEIYSCNADGSNITRLTNAAAADGYPVWSPDGTRIAFIRSTDLTYNSGNLYIMNADGTNVIQRTFTNDAKNPAWSPDGTRIAYTDLIDETFNVGRPSIMVMNLATGAVSYVPDASGSSVEPAPAWSPDGTRIAFDSDWNAWDFISDIFTICPNGSNRSILTSQFFNDYDYWKPSWSPNGMKLSVTIYQIQYLAEHDGSVAVMNADGTGLTLIMTGIVMPMFGQARTSWSPDGTRIVYTDNKTVKWVTADGSASGTIIANGWDADWKH